MSFYMESVYGSARHWVYTQSRHHSPKFIIIIALIMFLSYRSPQWFTLFIVAYVFFYALPKTLSSTAQYKQNKQYE